MLNRTLRLGQLDASGFDAVVTGSMDMIELWSRELASPDFDTADGAEDAEAPTGALRPDIMIRG